MDAPNVWFIVPSPWLVPTWHVETNYLSWVQHQPSGRCQYLHVCQRVLISVLITACCRPQEPINTQILFCSHKNIQVIFKFIFNFTMKHNKFSTIYDIIVMNFVLIFNIFHWILDRESDSKISLKKVVTDGTVICRSF